WQRHAAVGVVLAHGPVQDNESSKIYYELRAGLPVICERPVPNSSLITEWGCGALVDLDDMEAMAAEAARFAAEPPPAGAVIDAMIRDHSWDERAARYAPLIAEATSERAALTS
ncbi:MAG: hypothetical protein ABIZ34_10720, partial [Candidatus Limnocylindrales bacterium]